MMTFIIMKSSVSSILMGAEGPSRRCSRGRASLWCGSRFDTVTHVATHG